MKYNGARLRLVLAQRYIRKIKACERWIAPLSHAFIFQVPALRTSPYVFDAAGTSSFAALTERRIQHSRTVRDFLSYKAESFIVD